MVLKTIAKATKAVAKAPKAIKVADKVASTLPKVKRWVNNAVAAHAYNKAASAAKKFNDARSAYYKTDDTKQPVTAKIRQKQAARAYENMEKSISNYFKVWGKMTKEMEYGNSWRLANSTKKTAKDNLSSRWVSSKKKK